MAFGRLWQLLTHTETPTDVFEGIGLLPIILVLHDAGNPVQAVCELLCMHSPHRQLIEPFHEGDIRLRWESYNILLHNSEFCM